jgi:alkylation response protein AidB-like acyl-CoA dehydrogenase
MTREWFETEELTAAAETVARFASREIAGKVVDVQRLGRPPFPRQAIERLAELGFLSLASLASLGSLGSLDPVGSVGSVGAEGMPAADLLPGEKPGDSLMQAIVLLGLAQASPGFAAIVAAHYAAVQSLSTLPQGATILEEIGESGLLGSAFPSHTDDATWICAPSPAETERTLLFLGQGEERRAYLLRRDDLVGKQAGESALEPILLSGCEEMRAVRLRLAPGLIAARSPLAEGAQARQAQGRWLSQLKLGYAAALVGNARAATQEALRYTCERRQTGRVIIEHQGVRQKILAMEARNQAMMSFLLRAALAPVDDVRFNLCDLLLDFVRDTAEEVCNDALQQLGGYGYMREYGLEKRLRDVKTLQALLPTRLSDWLGCRG